MRKTSPMATKIDQSHEAANPGEALLPARLLLRLDGLRVGSQGQGAGGRAGGREREREIDGEIDKV